MALAADLPLTTLAAVTDLIARARTWIAGDPDLDTRSELSDLLDGDDLAELHDRMDGTLSFGTAGIRGEVGAGPNRMNRAVVIRTTRGLADHLVATLGPSPVNPVIVGFDARPTSRQFAEDAAGVLAAAGIPVLFFDKVTPTPLVAFAAKHLHAGGAVVITASHNPPADNGYKVYGGNAAQIVPPTDVQIAEAIANVGPAIDVPRVEDAFTTSHHLIAETPEEVFGCYWDDVSFNRPDARSSDLRIVYTPLHGVGGAVLKSVFSAAGHTGLVPVAAQFEPDGTFPTVSFPNPEEEGALQLALELANETDADLVVANDPDADRLAVATPVGGGEWEMLSGNEVGALLGDYILRHFSGDETPIVINSIVSSPMLATIAELYGARHEITLTGFKWIVDAGLTLEQAGEGRFVFGYEEALGYTVGSTVRDKDGISAALVFCDLVAGLREKGLTVMDRLIELWTRAGLWVSAQHSIVRPGEDGAAAILNGVARLAEDPPSRLGDFSVAACTDYRQGAEARPPWLGEQALVELSLGQAGRILARPSGTEPKLKIYVDLRGDCGDQPMKAHAELSQTAAAVAGELADSLGI